MLKKLLTTFINWILYTSVFAALCALGLCMATERLITQTIPPLFTSLHIFIFGSSLVIYNIHYVLKKSSVTVSDRYMWTQRNRHWHWILLITGFLLCNAFWWMFTIEIFICCVVLAVLSFAYSLPLLPLGGKKLRDFGWIKITVLSGVWTIVTSVLPILYWNKPLSAFPYEILLRFVLLFILCLAFDIRDMQTDLRANIYTLPNRIGEHNTYRLINSMIVLFILLGIIQYLRYPSLLRLAGDLLTALLTKLAVNYTKKHPSDKAYLGLVDGIMLIYAVILLL